MGPRLPRALGECWLLPLHLHASAQVFTVWFDHPVNKMFADFKHRHTHLAFVQRVNDDDEGRDPFYELQGIVTLEDVLEELIQAEIVDESDVILDNVTKKPVQASQSVSQLVS